MDARLGPGVTAAPTRVLSVPWLTGPEMAHDAVARSTGPHHGGFHYARGFQQGVDFLQGGGAAP